MFHHGGAFHGTSHGVGMAVGLFSGMFLGSLLLAAVVLAVLIFAFYRISRAQRAAGRTIPESMAANMPAVANGRTAAAGAALLAMRGTDPEFEPETFLQRAQMTFFLVKRAYALRDPAAAQPYLVPSLFASWSADVQNLVADHRRALLDDLNVRGLHVADAAHDAASGDRIVVHFDIVYRAKVLDDRDDRILSDSGDDERYGEDWTFVRAAGVKSVESGGVVAQKCPSCGAPLQLSTDAVCRFCHAQATTGAFDWSVAAIAPAPFTGLTLDPLLDQVVLPPEQGLAAIKAADPAFDEHAFIARAEQAFVALQAAWQARDVNPARDFMSPGLYFSWSAQVEQLTEQHRRNVLEGLHTDAIAPVRVLHGHVFDDVTLRIDATCADYEIDETTQRIVFGDKTPRPFTEFWTFQRAVGTKTGAHGLLDKTCPNCGAPLEVTQLGECRYCKAAVTSGRFDWVLSRIEQQEEYAEEFAGR